MRRPDHRVGEAVVGDVRGLDAAALDVVLDRLDAVLELARAVEQPEAAAHHRLVVDAGRPPTAAARSCSCRRCRSRRGSLPKSFSSTKNGLARSLVLLLTTE